MLKKLITFFAVKRNPLFKLNEDVTSGLLLSYMFRKLGDGMRGLRLCITVSKFNFIFLGKNVRIRGKKKFYYGKGVQIGDNVEMLAYGKQGLTIDDHVWIGANSMIKVSFSFNAPGEFIRIGKNVGIGEFAHLGGAAGLTIDRDCIIGPYFSCHPENHIFSDTYELIRNQPVSRKGIYISRNCWIGAKVTILDGVHIGENCVIAAGSVVTKDIPSHAIVAGVPAKVIRFRDEDNANIKLKIAV